MKKKVTVEVQVRTKSVIVEQDLNEMFDGCAFHAWIALGVTESGEPKVTCDTRSAEWAIAELNDDGHGCHDVGEVCIVPQSVRVLKVGNPETWKLKVLPPRAGIKP